jgi:dTDP-4-dehydrorhamnose 3,5-epimerase-like enzyme
MAQKPSLIAGGKHSDERGTLTFLNDFNLQWVKRMYFVENANTDLLRGWRGHQIEQRWFYAVAGQITIRLVEIDNWANPNPALDQLSYQLTVAANAVLHVPPGYASSLKALTQDAKLLVLGDYELEHAKNDDYLYPVDYFKNTP